MKQGVTVSIACALAAASMSLAAQSPFPVGGGIRAPVKINDVRPVYPPAARQARVQGVVILEITIETDGAVSDARVLRSIPLLDQAALDTVRQWRYQPTLVNNAPVPVKMTAAVNFALDGGPSGPTTGIVAGIVGGVPGGVTGGFVGSSFVPPVPGRSFMVGGPDGVDVYELTDERLAGLPSWDQQTPPEPPLSLGAAIVSARLWLAQRHPEYDRFDLMTMSINPLNRSWIYQLRFYPVASEPRVRGGMLLAVVLLDGSVLEPRHEPRPQ